MPISLLLQMFATGQPRSDTRSVFTTASTLTLRRLAVLSILEKWNDTLVASEAFEEIIRRNNQSELESFLSSKHLVKHLSKNGALGYALSEAAEKGLVSIVGTLASKTTPVERCRAALRSASVGNGDVLFCLFKSCKSGQEEETLLKASLIQAAINNHCELLGNISQSLHLLHVHKLSSPAPLYSAATHGLECSVKILLQNFIWTTEEIQTTKTVWNRANPGTPFPMIEDKSFSQMITTKEELMKQVEENTPYIINVGQMYDAEALLMATKLGFSDVITALLSIRGIRSDSGDLKDAILLACEIGNEPCCSRLLYQFNLENSPLVQEEMLARCLLVASEYDHSRLALIFARKLTTDKIHRACVYACRKGNFKTLKTLLPKLSSSATINQLEEIIISGATEGHSDCVICVSQSFPEHSEFVQELARNLVMRAARIGDTKLAEASASLLNTRTAGGMGTAAVLTARKHGFDDVVSALVPLKRGVSSFLGYSFVELNDDVFDRIFMFLDLRSLANITNVCIRFNKRLRIQEQNVRALIADYLSIREGKGVLSYVSSSSFNNSQNELVRLARILSSASLQPSAYEMETTCKVKAIEHILTTAINQEWLDVMNICAQLALAATDADVSVLVESLMNRKSKDGEPVLLSPVIVRMFNNAVKMERLKSLMVICRVGIPDGRLGTRHLVNISREEAQLGNTSTVSLLLASLSREALVSRRERDALWTKRRLEWERRGGVWGPLQEEEERRAGRTEQEKDLDDAISGALRRSACAGHNTIISSLLKMLRARGRIEDFSSDMEKAFEGACRGGYDAVLSELFSYVQLSEAALMESLMAAARNGHAKVARLLVLEGRLPLSNIRSKFMESARRGHVEALNSFLVTGAVGAGMCGDALEEALLRGHQDCVKLLNPALERLKKFEEEEERLNGAIEEEEE